MLLKVERADILDDEAVIDITLRCLEPRPGEPYLRPGEFRLSYGTARELHKALGGGSPQRIHTAHRNLI